MRILPLALLLLAAAVTAAGIVGVFHFRNEASARTGAQLSLAEVRADSNTLDSTEWHAIGEGNVSGQRLRSVARLQRGVRSRLALLSPADRAGINGAFRRYAGALDRELALLAADRPEEAGEVDESSVDPSFDALNDRFAVADRRLRAAASDAEAKADTAGWLILGFSALAVIALLAIFDRVRRRVFADRIANRSLSHQATHDALTGLRNRRYLLDRLGEEVEAALDREARLAVLLIDLDRFKEINDTLGHQAGDLLLQQLKPRLESVLREGDVLARLGGDEFALLVPAGAQVETSAVCQLAERIGEAIVEPFEVHGLSIGVRASIGIALFPEHGEDSETLLRHADVAMYRAKGEGNGHELYASEADSHSREQLVLSAELKTGIEAGQLIVHYQPLVELRSAEVVGVEALVRWQHPERGLLYPDQFLASAEQAGLSRLLTRHVLATALTQHAAWTRQGIELTLAVNLSAADLVDPGLPADVAQALREHGVDVSALQLEITGT